MKLKSFLRIIAITLGLMVGLVAMTAGTTPEAAYAASSGGGFKMDPVGPNLFQTQDQAVSGTSGATASTDDYPWNSDPRKVGLDSRSGTNLTQYLGEVPAALKDNSNCQNLYYLDGTIKDGDYNYTRTFQSRTSCDDASTLQYQGLERNQQNLLANGFATVTSSIVWLAQQLNYLLLMIKNLDLIGFINTASGGILSQMKEILVWNANGPAVPLIIALCVFIISLVPTIWRYFKGNGGGAPVWNKLGVLFLSFLLVGAALSNAPTLMVNWSSQFATQVQQSVVSSSSASDGSSCEYSTNNASMDALRTMYCGQMTPVFENAILNEFGYSSTALNVKDFPNWSGALTSAFGDASNGSPNNPFKNMDNLGWYWANSQTGITSGNDFSTNNSRSADDQRSVLIIDFLDALRTQPDNVKNADLQDKIATIAQNLSQPNYSGYAVNNLLLIVYYILNLIVMLSLTAFILVGVVSVSLIGVMTIALPILVYFRVDLVKDILKTYVMGFLRLLIGAVLTVMYISLTAILFTGDFYAAVATSIVIGLALAKFGPRLLRQLNQEISKHETFAPIRSMNREMNKYIYDRGGVERAVGARNERARKINENKAAIAIQENRVDKLDNKVELEEVVLAAETKLEEAFEKAERDLIDGKGSKEIVAAALEDLEKSKKFVDLKAAEEAKNSTFHAGHDLGHITPQEIAAVLNGKAHIIRDGNSSKVVSDSDYRKIPAGQRPSTINPKSDISKFSALERAQILNGQKHIVEGSDGSVNLKTHEEAQEMERLKGLTLQSKADSQKRVHELQSEVKSKKKKVLFSGIGNAAGAPLDYLKDSHSEATVVIKAGKKLFGKKDAPEIVTFNENDF